MANDRPIERHTLRELLSHAEKLAREVSELVQGQYLPKAGEFRELSRVRRDRTHYPTLHILDNAAGRLLEVRDRMKAVLDHLHAIDERVRKERLEVK